MEGDPGEAGAPVAPDQGLVLVNRGHDPGRRASRNPGARADQNHAPSPGIQGKSPGHLLRRRSPGPGPNPGPEAVQSPGTRVAPGVPAKDVNPDPEAVQSRPRKTENDPLMWKVIVQATTISLKRVSYFRTSLFCTFCYGLSYYFLIYLLFVTRAFQMYVNEGSMYVALAEKI